MSDQDDSTRGEAGEDGALRLRPGAVSWREVDGEVILLDLETSDYSGVNPSGSLLWSMLAEGTTAPALERALVEAYDVEPTRAADDVAAFLEVARSMRLLDG